MKMFESVGCRLFRMVPAECVPSESRELQCAVRQGASRLRGTSSSVQHDNLYHTRRHSYVGHPATHFAIPNTCFVFPLSFEVSAPH